VKMSKNKEDKQFDYQVHSAFPLAFLYQQTNRILHSFLYMEHDEMKTNRFATKHRELVS